MHYVSQDGRHTESSGYREREIEHTRGINPRNSHGIRLRPVSTLRTLHSADYLYNALR